MKLIENSLVTGNIVVSANADQREIYAAKQLRYYLQLMIGNPVEAKRIESAEDDAVIVLGSARTLYAEGSEQFGEDELHWFTKDGKLFIDGGLRGLLYSVYDFLESIGCRFFTPKCEKVPTYENLDIPETDKRDKPAYVYRTIYSHFCASDGVFGSKCRVNGCSPLTPEMGGAMNGAGGVHTFKWLMPYNDYFKKHPEWYALRNGVRGMGDYVDPNKKAYWDLCLTNPEVIETLTENTRKYLKENPTVKIMSISQNDSGDICQCENCLAVDAVEGCRTGLVLRTVNAVAEALEEEFPDVLFEHLAYHQNEALPKVTKPRHNVSIKLCAAKICCLHPITSNCPFTPNKDSPTSFIQNIKDWGQFGRPLFIWTYLTSFAHYNIPYPNWRILQPNLQFFYENNGRSIFSQCNISKGGGADLEELRAYLITKLMWNPYCDFYKLMEEFTDYYYGAGGKYVREYINTLCDCAENANEHFVFNLMPEAPFFTPEHLEKYNEIIARAYDAVKDDPVLAERVHKITLSIRYVAAHQQHHIDNNHDAALINGLFSDFKAYGIEEFEEGLTTEDALLGFLHDLPRARYGRHLWEL